MSRGAAARLLARIVRSSGVTSPTSPHALRRTLCTGGLISGVPLRDMQYAMRRTDARTTMRYDMARANLDRHAAHSDAAYSGLLHMWRGRSLMLDDPGQGGRPSSWDSRRTRPRGTG
jgi:integrase